MENIFKRFSGKKQESGLYELPWQINSIEECNFYHSTDIPGLGLVEGQWDLREGFDEYLGGYDFAGKRVLEIGPATGFLTFRIEKTAHQVTFHQQLADKTPLNMFTVISSRPVK